jgi:hypothetical protein
LDNMIIFKIFKNRLRKNKNNLKNYYVNMKK